MRLHLVILLEAGEVRVTHPGRRHCGAGGAREMTRPCFMGEPSGQAAKAPKHAGIQSREDLAVLVRLGGAVLRGDTAKFLRSQAMARDISTGAGRVSRSRLGKGICEGHKWGSQQWTVSATGYLEALTCSLPSSLYMLNCNHRTEHT